MIAEVGQETYQAEFIASYMYALRNICTFLETSIFVKGHITDSLNSFNDSFSFRPEWRTEELNGSRSWPLNELHIIRGVTKFFVPCHFYLTSSE